MSIVAPQLIVTTREVSIADAARLIERTSASDPLVWLRRGDGFVGVGPRVATVSIGEIPEAGRGARMRVLAERWAELVAGASVIDPLGLPGTGLVGFVAGVFSPSSAADTVLVVPSAIVGRSGDRAWVTTVSRIGSSEGTVDTAPVAYGEAWSATVGAGQQTASAYMDSVRAGVQAIAAGEVSKVVLARDLPGAISTEDPDLRRLVRTLAAEYPDTWVFAIDGIMGASPETLVTVKGGTVTARVLAGTASRGTDPDSDAAASAALIASAKDLDEHRYAVQSLLGHLAPLVRASAAAEHPFVLTLPNLFHLATDVEATLASDATVLDLVAALHPTAAVAGTPTDAAMALIDRLEPFDRQRYAGPVGWVGANGDGEFAIALRCAEFDDDGEFVAYAGAGIVAESDPESELLETRVKFRPIVDALA